MVEEMYQQEAKEEGADHVNEGSQTTQTQRDDAAAGNNQTAVSQSSSYHHSNPQQHNPQGGQSPSVPEIDASERFPSVDDDNNNNNNNTLQQAHGGGDDPSSCNPINLPPIIDTPDLCGAHDDLYRQYGAAAGLGPATRMRVGTSGDVSLTLGLRHAGNAPEKNRSFSIRDFGGC